MKYRVVAIVLTASLVAPQTMATPANEIGKMYANTALCKIEGHITKLQKDTIKFNITKKHDLGKKSHSFKDQVYGAEVNELNKMINNGGKRPALICATLINKWFY